MEKFFQRMERYGFSRGGTVLIGILLAVSLMLVLFYNPAPPAVPQSPTPPQLINKQPATTSGGTQPGTTQPGR